jgi:hypothetical protein
MKQFYKWAYILLLMLCFTASYIVLIPPIPSEADSHGRLDIFNLPTLVSLVLFILATLLFKKSRIIFSKRDGSKTKLFLFAYGILLGIHFIMRIMIWQFGHLSEYGHPIYNIFLHSIVYSLVMSVIFIVVAMPWKKES